MFIVSFIMCFMVIKLDILPSKYISLLIIVVFIINIFFDFILFRKKVKKFKRNIALCFAVLFIFLFFIPIVYAKRTISFMNTIGAVDYKIENYSVIVLKDSKYNKIADLGGVSVGIYDNTDGIIDAKDMLSNKIDVTFDNYDSTNGMIDDLINKKIEALVIEDSIFSMIKEDNVELEGSIKVLYTFNIKIKSKNDAKSVDVVKEPFNIYITGIDTFGDISSVSRSDVNIVMTVNPKTKQILLTSIPRDYYVELHGKKGSRDKLTHAGIYGTDMSISTIEDLLGIDINYYIKVNFSSFIDIVNTLGEIDVYSKYSFTSMDGFKYTEGYNKLNGEEALSFARERKAFVEGDRQRGADQQAVIEAIIKKMCNKSILTKYDSLLSSIEGKFQTNMSNKVITSLIKMQLNDMATWNVTSISLDGSNGRGITYSGGNLELYVMIPNWDTVDEASSTIQAVLEGVKIDDSFKADKSKSKRVVKSYSNNVLDNNSKNQKVEEKSDKDDKIEDKTLESKSEIINEVVTKDDEDKIEEIEIVIDDKNKSTDDKNLDEEKIDNNTDFNDLDNIDKDEKTNDKENLDNSDDLDSYKDESNEKKEDIDN